ncbi:hypothetical protein ACOMHN_058939 [Nucella lapillus]
MTVRDFKGIDSIKEIICQGKGLQTEVKLLSLKLYKISENDVQASLNIYANTCMTYADYSSCRVNSEDTHSSVVKVLVWDLKPGQSRRYGCKATVVRSEGDANEVMWSLVVTRRGQWVVGVVVVTQGESRTYGCKLTLLDSAGDASDVKRSLVVRRDSELKSVF